MKTRLALPTLLLAASLAWTCCWAGPALACGTVRGWIYTYNQGEHHKALFHLFDCASSYRVPADDRALLPVIMDALGRGEKVAELAVAVFNHYNRLYGARHDQDYPALLQALRGRGADVSLNMYKDWMVVTPKSGANLRDAPGPQGRVLTSLIHGMQAKVLDRSGEWVKVKPVGPGAVDPRFERKTGYVHQSLLAPY